MKIGFIGTGDISKAMVLGLNRSDYPYDEIIVSSRSAHISAMLAKTCARVSVSDNNQQIVDEADSVILAVLPRVAEEVISGLSFKPGQLVISVIAALANEKLEELIGPDVTIVRANPLPFAAVGAGVTAILPDEERTSAIFNAMGEVIPTATIEEYDALVASNTFMGTFFGLQEEVVGWLKDKGIEEKQAQSYIAATFLGLAQTGVDDNDKSLAELRKDHSTTGGLNEQVYRMFKEEGGLKAFIGGIQSVYERIRRVTPSE